jgi:hypothetical protein
MNHKNLLALIFIVVSELANAQFAKIVNKDGYVVIYCGDLQK